MTTEQHLKYILRLADDNFILGHRFSEWCSFGPFLEEDIAMTNIALDLIGRSSSLYKHAAAIEGNAKTEDDYVYKRAERNFYCIHLVQTPDADFGYAMTKLFLISAFQLSQFEQLAKSKDEVLAGIAAKALKEVKYHYRHASQWMLRLGDGTAESHAKIQKSLNDIWMYTGELFMTDEIDMAAEKAGYGVTMNSIKEEWNKRVNEIISEATLTRPADGFMQKGGRNGIHTEYLGFMLSEIQYLQRAYPDAKW
jgi:ring-1,2-phenylacetyl-CoA epoxidase subunit PaaC